MKYILLLLLVWFSVTFANATDLNTRSGGVAVDFGYKFNTRSTGYLGASFSLYNRKRIACINSGIGMNVAKFGGKAQLYPSAYISFTKLAFELGVESSRHDVAPYFGINFLNYGRMKFGHSIQTDRHKRINLSGFFCSLIFSFGTKGYYIGKM